MKIVDRSEKGTMAEAITERATRVDWIPAERLWLIPPPAALASLLTERGSLTDRLRASSQGDFSVRVLGQRTCDLGELPDHLLDGWSGPGLVREVYLVSCGRPVVYARTLVPEATLRAHPWLADLGERALGQRLFARDDVCREPFEFARLRAEDGLAVRAVENLAQESGIRAPLWARRSRFLIDGLPVSVNEVFFPAAVVAVP